MESVPFYFLQSARNDVEKEEDMNTCIHIAFLTIYRPLGLRCYSSTFSISCAFLDIMDGKKLEYKGKDALKEIEKLTEKAGEIQESILKEILMQNGKTEYLSEYIGESRDVKDFKRCVPVSTYTDIYPYIQRIANGEDSSLISGHPITEMLCSSGTSAGEPKLMPSIAEDLDRRTFIYNLIMPIVNQLITSLYSTAASAYSYVSGL